MKKNNKKILKFAITILIIIIALLLAYLNDDKENSEENLINTIPISYDISNIPNYSGEIYVIINNNIPEFSEDDFNIEEDYYSNIEDGKVRNGNGKDKLD